MNSNLFSQLISKRLEEKQWSIRELARRIGFDASYLSKVLKGKRSPPHNEKKLRHLANMLNIEADLLFLSAGRIPKKYLSKKRIQKLLVFFRRLKTQQ